MVALSRWACSLLLLACVGACSAESPSETPAGAASAAGPNRADEGSVKARCAVGDAVDPATRKAIAAQALSIIESLRRADDDALWDELHPQARRDDQRQAFLGALASMRDRLATTSGEFWIERVDVVDLSGGANELAVIECGATDDPTRFTFMANAGSEDVAVISMSSNSPAGAFATTVQLRRRGERWRLLGLHASPSTFRGKDALAYEKLADTHMGQQRVVVAHMLLGLARLLSERGASVKTGMHDRVSQKQLAIERDQLFVAETASWTLGEARFRIQGLSLVATADGMSPVFEYISPQGLVKDLLDRDADALVAEVRRRFPELGRYFDAVVFEAYADVPNEPGKSYQAYRVVRFLDPNKKRG